MAMYHSTFFVGLLLSAGAGFALAAATNPVIYTSPDDCRKLPSLKGVENCRKCLPNGRGDVWIVGQGCGKHPAWVSGTAVKAAADCQWVEGAGQSSATCNACVSGGSQYVVGAGCCAQLNQQRILTQGCVLDTQALCKKITSATAVSSCLDCLKRGKTFTLGSGCAP